MLALLEVCNFACILRIDFTDALINSLLDFSIKVIHKLAASGSIALLIGDHLILILQVHGDSAKALANLHLELPNGFFLGSKRQSSAFFLLRFS